MRTAFLALVFAMTVAPADAQLLPVNDTGMVMGHVLVNVTNVDAHKKFWMESFDAKPVKVGTLEGVTIPGLVLFFRH